MLFMVCLIIFGILLGVSCILTIFTENPYQAVKVSTTDIECIYCHISFRICMAYIQDIYGILHCKQNDSVNSDF